jgi:membrane protease YdiL (CAAX protease family)
VEIPNSSPARRPEEPPGGPEGTPGPEAGAPVAPPPAPSPPVTAPARPYGPWATLGAYALVVVIYFGAGVAVVAGVVVAHLFRGTTPDLEKLGSNGWVLSLSTLLAVPCMVGLCALLVRLRRGWTLREYLGTGRPGWGAVLGWVLATGAFIAAGDLLLLALGRPVVTDFMIESYRTVGWTPLIWVALVAAAPLGEETFFRGFFFRGIQATRAGTAGAVILSSLVWAVLHLQYDLYGLVWVFLTGILFGTARWRTNSISLTIGLHALVNLVATVEVAVATTA